MSDQEDNVQVEKADDDVEEYVTPISALPPRVVLQEENQVEVSSSPAFQCLDEVERGWTYLICLVYLNNYTGFRCCRMTIHMYVALFAL